MYRQMNQVVYEQAFDGNYMVRATYAMRCIYMD